MSELPPNTHNNPPSELELLRERLVAATAGMAKRVDELSGAADRCEKREITDADVASAFEDQIKQFDEVWKALEGQRTAALAPIDQQRSLTHNHYKILQDKVADFKKRVSKILNAWQTRKKEEEEAARREEAERARQQAEAARRDREAAERREREKQEAARRAQEEAERKQRLADQAALAAQKKKDAAAREKAEAAARKKAAEAEAARRKAEDEARRRDEAERDARRSRQREVTDESIAQHTAKQARDSKAINRTATVRGAYGGVASLRKTYDFKIVDEDAIPRRWLTPAESRIRDAINSGVSEIPGVEIFEVNTTVTK